MKKNYHININPMIRTNTRDCRITITHKCQKRPTRGIKERIAAITFGLNRSVHVRTNYQATRSDKHTHQNQKSAGNKTGCVAKAHELINNSSLVRLNSTSKPSRVYAQVSKETY